MTEYVTTTIRLPKQLYRDIKRLDEKENKSMAQVLREGVVQYIATQSSAYPPVEDMEDDDPLWLIGVDPVDLGVTDASVNFDEHLYGPLAESAKAEIKEA